MFFIAYLFLVFCIHLKYLQHVSNKYCPHCRKGKMNSLFLITPTISILDFDWLITSVLFMSSSIWNEFHSIAPPPGRKGQKPH